MISAGRKHELMSRAVELSLNGGRAVAPNPMVGAVIFNDAGEILSEGWHAKYGGNHAEVAALKKLGCGASGLNMAVSLEPCSHYGKTPPCTKAIIEAGIKFVMIAACEPSAKACNGASILTENSVKVEFLREFEPQVREINRFFFKTALTGKPFVAIKSATTIDGFIALRSGESKYISNELSRTFAHKLRAEFMAIAVGSHTVNNDDPELTVRLVEGVNPRPVIFSKNLNLAHDRKIYSRNPIVFTVNPDSDHLKNKGCEIALLNDGPDFISDALKTLWEKYHINSLLVEGGGRLNYSILKADEADEIYHCVAPFALGDGIPMFDGKASETLAAVKRYSLKEVKRFDDDVLSVYKK